MSAADPDVVIWGLTTAGRKFRPSDWSERLAGLTSAFGHDRKLAYSRLVAPVTLQGIKAVIVGRALEGLEPRLFAFMIQFAHDNELQMSLAHKALAGREYLAPPTAARVAAEPREPV